MIPLRLVIDTNVVVSAAIKPDGMEHSVLILALTPPARYSITISIFREYETVLARPELKIRKSLRRQLLDLIETRAHVVQPKRRVIAATNPEDNKFLECADAAHADYLITGNLRHFPPKWKQTQIVNCRQLTLVIGPSLPRGEPPSVR